MIISEAHKLIFFRNSKTGTTSIEKALAPFGDYRKIAFDAAGLHNEKHIPPAIVKALVPQKLWDECFKFVFVRNPYDWFVSQWFHNFAVSAPKNVSWPRYLPRNIMRRRRNHQLLSRYGRGLKVDHHLSRREHFTEDDVLFLYNVLKGEYRTLPIYDGKLQICYLWDADGRQIVDFVGRFERLERDFNSVMERVGLDVHLNRLNTSEHRHYSTYYGRKSANLVYDLWKIDFDALGYQKNP